ncbi:ATPase, T2SS/T4P/T4SS family [Sphingomonas sp. LB-2]|nr:ATPase, T2SS/T4P/T4SS family [Sphingomonas caeni]
MDLAQEATLPSAEERPALFGEAGASGPVAEMLDRAVAAGASHVHLDRDGDALRVRFRVAGRLLDAMRLPAGADLGFERNGISVATLDERIVLHLAPRDTRYPALEALGMTPGLARTIGGITGGLVLVAGPPRSGRSTTLATLLAQSDDGAHNLLAAASAAELHAVLRQDPDAILIDSVADREMAALALQAAEAGHLVLAGVDAGDAVGAILRLRALRADPFQLASTLRAVLSQRLVKRLCGGCRRPVQAQGSTSSLLGFDAGTVVYAAEGCGACESGFTGRTAVFEAIHVDAALRRLINDNGDSAIISRHAFLSAPNLGSAARTLVREGVTTAEEAVRVSRG